MRHRVPPKHDRKFPRGWFDLFYGKGGIKPVLAGVLLVVLTVVSVLGYQKAARFDREGEMVKATIVRMWIDQDDDGDTYHARFRYVIKGRAYEGRKNVGSKYYRQASVGDIREVRYLPSDPGTFEYYVGEARDNAFFWQMAAGGAGVLALGLMYWIGRRVNRAVLARDRGYLAVATVQSITERKNSGKLTGRGYMRFKTEDGITGETMDRAIGELRRIGKGAKINVYVRNGHAVWEGDVGPRDLDPSRLPKVDR